jgi:hypothetical protein
MTEGDRPKMPQQMTSEMRGTHAAYGQPPRARREVLPPMLAQTQQACHQGQ